MAESASYTRRGHGGAARETTLASGADAVTNSLTATDLSTWTSTISSGPARATLTDGTNEEEVEYTGISTNTLTGVTRGVGGTTAQAWSAGVTLYHGSSVRDFDEANYAVAETVGKITAANQLLVGDGANSLAALSVGASRIVGRKASGDVVALTAAEVVDVIESELPSGLLAVVSYNPATGVETQNATSTAADIDATNLAVTFTVPASGEVLIRLTGDAINNDTNGHAYWLLREGSSSVSGTEARVITGTTAWIRSSHAILITGLTPAAEKTYKWAQRTNGTGIVGLGYGVSNNHGAAVMEVWAAP